MISRVDKFKAEARKTRVVAYMPGTFASYLAVSQQNFFRRAEALIKRVAGNKADVVLVMRSKGDVSASLVYKGSDETGAPLKFSVEIGMGMLFPDTMLKWNGSSVLLGRFDGKRAFKASRLKPDDVMEIFRRYFEAQ